MKLTTKTLKIFHEKSESNLNIHFFNKMNLLALLNANKISVLQSCDGNGTCTTCRIFIKNNQKSFENRTEVETERSLERSFDDCERLACQTIIVDSAEISIPSF